MDLEPLVLLLHGRYGLAALSIASMPKGQARTFISQAYLTYLGNKLSRVHPQLGSVAYRLAISIESQHRFYAARLKLAPMLRNTQSALELISGFWAPGQAVPRDVDELMCIGRLQQLNGLYDQAYLSYSKARESAPPELHLNIDHLLHDAARLGGLDVDPGYKGWYDPPLLGEESYRSAAYCSPDPWKTFKGCLARALPLGQH